MNIPYELGIYEIEWQVDAELEIVSTYDEETDVAETSNELFSQGTRSEVDIIEDNGETVDIQFGDGSMAFGVSKVCFRRLKPQTGHEYTS